jgi:hypothetical protein
VRIRIVKPLQGIVQGVSLAHLAPGATYDVDATLGGYLVTVGAAEAVVSKRPAVVIPLDMTPDLGKALGGVSVTRAAEAADQPRRKPQRSVER